MDKGIHLQKIFGTYGDRHELVVVEDITKEGAFDDAVKGVDGIAHTASPFHMRAEDPNAKFDSSSELIEPAVKGTVGILQSAFKYGSSVKRIVVTSSSAAIMQESPDPQVYSEVSWNEQFIEVVKKEGRAAQAWMKYRASKTLAEKAAWDFVRQNKDQLQWDLVVVNPPMVFGPPIHELSSPESLNTSLADWYETVIAPAALGATFTGVSSWIDVRDLAEAHKLALETAEAGGERLIISAGPYRWQDWINAASSLPADTLAVLAHPEHVPKGDPTHGSTAETVFPLSHDK
ncbi:hypothetical protein HWV62_23212 [Athelia sp. TMB]|nr:hypothetical protein HWV62_23212 [Athelia sp. TMB]